MSSFELSQKDDSRAHSADSLKAYSKLEFLIWVSTVVFIFNGADAFCLNPS